MGPEEKGELLPEGSGGLALEPELWVLGGKGKVMSEVPLEGPAMGKADSGRLDWMGVANPLEELLEGAACPQVLSGHLIRDRPEDWESLSWSRHPWLE